MDDSEMIGFDAGSKPVIVILGPTASGKTAVSLELASLLDIEIISADSRQVFKYLDIGTAKPDKIELSRVRHHFIDICNPDEYYSAGIFEEQAEKTIHDILHKNKTPVVVGGSGLYIQALCEGLFDENVRTSPETRKELQDLLDEKGIDYLHAELSKVDIDSANKYEDKNPRRIIRALEFYRTSGIAFSKAHKQQLSKKNLKFLYFGILIDREELYNRINRRAEQMWQNGLKDETSRILNMGYSPELNSMNTVGYKECCMFLQNKITEETAIDEMKKNTRHYAKRQMTWFSRNEKIQWLNGDFPIIANKIFSIFNNYQDKNDFLYK
jgi:tRNA dimethylallyltransferase